MSNDFEVTIHEEKGVNYRKIKSFIDENGDLHIHGHDIGPSTERFFNDDYAYCAIVPSERKAILYDKLKARLFSGQQGFDSWLKNNDLAAAEKDLILLHMVKKLNLFPHHFREWAEGYDIPVEFWSYA